MHLDRVPEEVAKPFLLLLSPMAPHITEEIWELAGFDRQGIQTWPQADMAKTEEETIVLPIQVNGKIRAQIEVAPDLGEEQIKEMVFKVESIEKYVPEIAQIKRFILVPGKIVNIVV